MTAPANPPTGRGANPDSGPSSDGDITRGAEKRLRWEAASFQRSLADKEARHWRTRSEKNRTLLFGLGMFGLVGWSVAVPTLLGIAAGIWIDRHWPSAYSWTLMLLLGGVVTGCLHAWHWIQKAGRQIRED